jgi:hypothetical protein
VTAILIGGTSDEMLSVISDQLSAISFSNSRARIAASPSLKAES